MATVQRKGNRIVVNHDDDNRCHECGDETFCEPLCQRCYYKQASPEEKKAMQRCSCDRPQLQCPVHD